MKRKALGKGLDALLGEPLAAGGASIAQIPLERIRPNNYQPRQQFAPEKLEELAASIRENGVLQPVIVRRAGQDFELVAGERRWRAAQLAGLDYLPAMVQDLSDERALEVALVENIQRDELSAIEEAHAYQILAQEFSLSHQDIARRVGRSRAAVANTLRLLKLPKPIQAAVVSGDLSMGHARALLPLPAQRQRQLAHEIQKRGLSVREVERRAGKEAQRRPRSPRPVDPNTRAAIAQLEEACKTKVEIRRRGKRGQLVLHFASEDELSRLYDLLLSRADRAR